MVHPAIINQSPWQATSFRHDAWCLGMKKTSKEKKIELMDPSLQEHEAGILIKWCNSGG